MCLNQQTNEQNCTLFIYKMSLCFTEKGDMYNACGGGLLPKNRNVKSWPSLPGGAGECVVQTHLCRLCVCVIQVWLTLQPHAVLSGSLEHCRWPDLLMSIWIQEIRKQVRRGLWPWTISQSVVRAASHTEEDLGRVVYVPQGYYDTAL